MGTKKRIKGGGRGGWRPGAGRPSIPEEERRRHRVTLHLRDDQREVLEAWAEGRGLGVGEAARVLFERTIQRLASKKGL